MYIYTYNIKGLLWVFTKARVVNGGTDGAREDDDGDDAYDDDFDRTTNFFSIPAIKHQHHLTFSLNLFHGFVFVVINLNKYWILDQCKF